MSLRHLKVVFWIAGFLVAIELALEVRAARRGWDTLLLGGAAGESADPSLGPTEGFPFRSPVVPVAKGDARRIWIASSSYGADVQLPVEDVFPNLLAEELGPSVQTLNASVDGYTIARNVEDLRAHGPLWRPDVCVLYQMSNDIDWISERLGVDETASIGAGDAAGGGPNWIQRTCEETTVFKHLKTQLTARLTKARVLLDTLGAEGEERFEAFVGEFVEAARELGAEPVLCTFATSHVRSNLDELPSEYEYNLLRFNIQLSLEGWLDSVERNNRVLERIAREEGLTLVDVAGALAGRSEHFRDFWHFRPEGHRIAAATIAGALTESGADG